MSNSTQNATPAPGRITLAQRFAWFGGKVLDMAEYIGEGVVSVLGLDDSHFQDVLDNMTEEEIQAAVEVNNQRNAEYRQAGLLPPQSEMPIDLTVEQVTMELIGPNGSARSYATVSSSEGTDSYDIEMKGEATRPVMPMSRAGTEDSEVSVNSSITTSAGYSSVPVVQVEASTHTTTAVPVSAPSSAAVAVPAAGAAMSTTSTVSAGDLEGGENAV